MDQVINTVYFKFHGMGKVCMKHIHNSIIVLLWKMVKNMFFLDNEHVGMGKWSPPPPPKKKSCLFMSDAWFQKIILLGYGFFVAGIISYVAKVYL